MNESEYVNGFPPAPDEAELRFRKMWRDEGRKSIESGPYSIPVYKEDGVTQSHMQLVPGTRRSYCRVEGCDEWTWGNVRNGYCPAHLLLHLQGVAQKERPSFPPLEICRCDGLSEAEMGKKL